MRRSALVLAAAAGLTFGLTASAHAVFDPLTRQPLVETYSDSRAQATAIPRETVAFNGAYAPAFRVSGRSGFEAVHLQQLVIGDAAQRPDAGQLGDDRLGRRKGK